MIDNQHTDDLLYSICRENSDVMKSLAPDFDKIEQGVKLKYKQRSRKSRKTIFFRIAAATISIIVILNAFLLFSEEGPVKAYRAEVRKLFFNLFNDRAVVQSEDMIVRSANEISRVQKSVPFTIPVPGWIPQEYQFDNVTMTDDGYDIYTINILYKSASNSLVLAINNDTDISTTLPSAGEKSFEHLVINGMDVYTSFTVRDNIERWMCMYYNKQGLNIYISGVLDKQSLLKIIESMN